MIFYVHKNTKNIFIFTLMFIVIFIFSMFVYSQESEIEVKSDQTTVAETQVSNEIDSSKEVTNEISDYDEKLEVLQYGLDTEIIALVEKLTVEKDDRFNQELQTILSKSKNPKVKYNIMNLFAKQKNPDIKDEVIKILNEFYDYKTEIVLASINYCKELELVESTESLHEIIKDDNIELKNPAIITLGLLGNSDDADFLVECFENEASADSKMSLIVRQNIMQALIELHEDVTWDFLLYTAEDSYENSIIRARAAIALGKIGRPEAVQILSKLYEDKDPVLREAAVDGLTDFSDEEAKLILTEAFKDSYYKVRLQAIKSACKHKNPEAVPYIFYRAKTDPEDVVKFAAIEALSESKDSKGLEWLKKSLINSKTGETMRLKIAKTLLEHNFDFIFDDVNKIAIDALNQKSFTRFAINLGTSIAKLENIESASIAEAYLLHSDPMVQSVGLDMFNTNLYASLIPKVQEIANQSKNSAIKRRAQILLECNKIPLGAKEDETPVKEVTPSDDEFELEDN